MIPTPPPPAPRNLISEKDAKSDSGGSDPKSESTKSGSTTVQRLTRGGPRGSSQTLHPWDLPVPIT